MGYMDLFFSMNLWKVLMCDEKNGIDYSIEFHRSSLGPPL